MIAGTPSRFRRAPRAIPPWPPPMTTHQGCVVVPSAASSSAFRSSQFLRCLKAPCSTPFSRVAPRRSSCPLSSVTVVRSVTQWSPSRRTWPMPRATPVSKVIHASVVPSQVVVSLSTSQLPGFTCGHVASRQGRAELRQPARRLRGGGWANDSWFMMARTPFSWRCEWIRRPYRSEPVMGVRLRSAAAFSARHARPDLLTLARGAAY